MTEEESRRWNGARAYAARQGLDLAAAREYADWARAGIRGGYIVLPATHEQWFGQWFRYASAQGR